MLSVQRINTQHNKRATIKNSSPPTFTATLPKMLIALKEAGIKPNAEEIKAQLTLLEVATKFFLKFEAKLPPDMPVYTFILGERNKIPKSLSKIDVDGFTLKYMDNFLHSTSPDNLGCRLIDVLRKLKIENPEVITLFKNVNN